VDVNIQEFLVSKLKWDQSASDSYRFTLGERAPGTHLVEICADPRPYFDVVVKDNIECLPEN
jgi:hypothetical protein